ncbi:MAG: hypothetical protein QW620_07870 [Thermoplasmata archaeon]
MSETKTKICVSNTGEYYPAPYSDEKEFEKDVLANAKHIFGEEVWVIEKAKMKTFLDRKAIPDGFLFFLHKKSWAILEIELAHHDLYDHIIKQINKFEDAIKNSQTIEAIREHCYEEIMEKSKFVDVKLDFLGRQDLHKLISDIVKNKPTIIVVIDENTEDIRKTLEERVDVLLEFKKYLNEQKDAIFVFDTIREDVTKGAVKKIEERERGKGGDGKRSKYTPFWEEKMSEILGLIDEAYQKGESHEIDVSELLKFGERQRKDWVGSARFQKGLIGISYRANLKSHLKALVDILIHKVPEQYEGIRWKVSISWRNWKLLLKIEKVRP